MVPARVALVIASLVVPQFCPGPTLAATAPTTPAPATASVRGVLLDAQGLPAMGYQVAVRTRSGDLFTSGPTLVDGSFVIAGLPPGSYRLVAFDPEGTEFPVLGREVTLDAGQVERLELKLGAPSGAPGRAARPVGTATGWWSRLGPAGKIAIVTAGAFALGYAVTSANDDDEEPPVSPR